MSRGSEGERVSQKSGKTRLNSSLFVRVQDVSAAFWHLAALLTGAFARILEWTYPYSVDFLSKFLGIMCFDIFRIRRRVVISNLSIAYPDWDLQQKIKVGRESVISFFQTSLELLASDQAFKNMQIDSTHAERLTQALSQGQGVYILCAHLGNWELMCWHGAGSFAQTHVVVKDIGKGALAKWVTDKRRSNRMQVIDRTSDLAATKQIFTALKRNNFVGFIVDQRRKKGTVASFFGRPCYTNDSLLHLWMRKKAPIVPVSMIRKSGSGHYHFRVFPEFAIEEKESSAATIAHNTQRMNDIVEIMVREAPEQYFWMHRRWKDFENL